jgi:hypothetical protein
MSTRETATSSTAHPVTGIAPATFVAPSVGVSKNPPAGVVVPAL